MYRTLITLCCVLLLAGCATLPPAPPPEIQGDYRLDTGDKVRVIVYNEQTLSTDYLVGDDGNLSFPMVGLIKARSMTVGQVQQEIRDGLKNGILKDPSVSVEVDAYRPFYILGEVAKPGQYPYATGTNVLTAIATAGGFTVRADKDRMTVVRSQDGHSGEWHADRLMELRPGDVIVVPERFF